MRSTKIQLPLDIELYGITNILCGAQNNNRKNCQEWDSNPCPFGPVPETGALDQLGHLDG